MKLETTINKASTILAYTSDYSAIIYKFLDEDEQNEDGWAIEIQKADEMEDTLAVLKYGLLYGFKANNNHNEWIWRNRIQGAINPEANK